MRERKDFWDKNAGLYDRFMRKDGAAYEMMYEMIQPVVQHKTVLELATGTGLIAKHIVNVAAHIEATDVHAMFTNIALIFKFTFEKYGDMQAAAEIANKVFYCNAAPLLAAYILCDVLLSVVMIVMIWKKMLPLKNTAQRILASFCNPIVFAGIVGNLFTLLPWPLDQIDHGTESAGHLLVLVLGLVLLREMAKSGECKETVQ